MTLYSEGLLSIFKAQQISTLSLQVSRNVSRENFARILLVKALFPFFDHFLRHIRSYRIWKWNLSGSNTSENSGYAQNTPKETGPKTYDPKRTLEKFRHTTICCRVLTQMNVLPCMTLTVDIFELHQIIYSRIMLALCWNNAGIN